MTESTPKRRKVDAANEENVAKALHLDSSSMRRSTRHSPRTSLAAYQTPAKTKLSTITQSTTNMAPIGVALVGAGIFVTEEHLPAVLACEQFSLKAVYSRSAASAKALTDSHPDVAIYSDDGGSGNTYHDLLLRDDVHAVIVALPILTQGEHIESALLAGKHVLSEKPIAGDLKRAKHLIDFYNSKIDKSKVIWAVAENFRFLDSFTHAAQEARKLGRVLGFSTKMHSHVKEGSKYYETSWRKAPGYQGGFLLDGGVHFIAGTRLLLGESARPKTVSAFTTLLQPHLPPVDTVNSIWATESGVSGTFSVSFGTSFKGSEYAVACEKGTVTIVGSKVTVEVDGKKSEESFDNEGSGVKQETVAWATSISSGKANPAQSPEQAFADLEILQKLLESGAGHGKIEALEHQI